MPWQSPRKQLFSCGALDFAGLYLAVGISNLHRAPDLLHPPLLIAGVGLLYCIWAWLLGSYTVLRWPWLKLRLVLQRLGLTALASWATLIMVSWVLGLNSDHVNLLNRSVMVEVLAWQTLVALLIRLQLRQLSGSSPEAQWQLLALPHHQQHVVREWQRNPFVRTPKLVSTDWLEDSPNTASAISRRPVALAVAHGIQLDGDQRSLIRQLQQRGVMVTTLEDLAQRQLERLPPTLLPTNWLTLTDLPWTNEFSLQRKLKRMADISIAVLLLTATAPVLLLTSCLIWLEDHGPVLYVQQRTGWMGHPFQLLKLRTMRVHQPGTPTPWTTIQDSRITRIGSILRRTRLDELPQLINVIRGEMSLIGPRPEQPHFDDQLSQTIPHYQKRYWMLPGLSGWAQVCGPAYPASLEESELKLSYDLFYLRHWSLGLDLLILAKTIKTLLKVRGV